MRILKRRAIVSVIVGLLSEILPLAGLLFGAIFFNEGIHSNSATTYLYLAYISNFFIVGGLTYFGLGAIERMRKWWKSDGNNQKFSNSN